MFVIEYFRKLVVRYKKLEPTSIEAKYVQQIKGMSEKLQKFFEVALLDATENQRIAGTQKNTTENSGVKYSIKRTEEMPWHNQILGYYKKDNSIRHSDTLVVFSYTPNYLLREGMNNYPIALPIKVISKAQSGKDILHTVSKNTMLKLRDGMKGSIAEIYDSDNDTLFIISGLKDNGLPVCVAVKMNDSFDGDDVHRIRSVHIRQNVKSYLSNLKDKEIFIKNKKEFIALCREVNSLDRLRSDNKLIDIKLSHIYYNVKKNSFSDIEEVTSLAESHFGTTYNWKETGYILTNGKRLDFSGKKVGAPAGQRSMDHREIIDCYNEEMQDKLSGSEAMVDFMKRGNIRVSPEIDGINLSAVPTKEQESTLREFITRARGEIFLDIDNEYGDTEISVEYPRGTSSAKILNDIKDYFENGIEPYVSDVSKFRYSYKVNTDYSDLSKLDAESLKIYNNRGWARSLLTKEDNALLNRRLGEIFHENSKYVKTTLADGTVVLDLNNKMLLVSGNKLGEEVIHGVVAISATSESYAEYIKGVVYDEIENYGYDGETVKHLFNTLQRVSEEDDIRFYNADDYHYNRGQHDSGERATLPDDWQNYGYTTGKQDGRGVSSETQNGLPRGVLNFQLKSYAVETDSQLLVQHLEENSEAVGEILRRSSEINMNEKTMTRLVSKRLRVFALGLFSFCFIFS